MRLTRSALIAALALAGSLSVANAQPFGPPGPGPGPGPGPHGPFGGPPPGWAGPHFFWHGRHWHHRRWYHHHWTYY